MRIKSGAPIIVLIISLFAVGIIAIQSIVPTALVMIILYVFQVKITLKLFLIVLSIITIVRGSIAKPQRIQFIVKEEES